jgi:hypothetical protein
VADLTETREEPVTERDAVNDAVRDAITSLKGDAPEVETPEPEVAPGLTRQSPPNPQKTTARAMRRASFSPKTNHGRSAAKAGRRSATEITDRGKPGRGKSGAVKSADTSGQLVG